MPAESTRIGDGVLWRIFLRILALFDAERLHHWSFRWLRILGRSPAALRAVSGARTAPTLPAPSTVGFPALHPVGLAAGFDKNAEILDLLPLLGFGFAEIGTVTPRAQEGNARPRLFRDYSARAIFNRMGFNNLGADTVARRLEAARSRLPVGFGVGVNLGKNKDTPDDDAAKDYALVAERFRGLADYFVVNVSSPNTPGLRRLQDPRFLLPILESAKKAAYGTPVFVKLAPEIRGPELARLIEALDQAGCDGFVLGNTLGGERDGQPGGWSGAPLTAIAADNLTAARSATRRPIISVGGILDGAEARARMEAGAQAVQIYTGWVMGGPRLPERLRLGIATSKPASAAT